MLLLPDQPGTKKHLAIALGKDGAMYLLDRDDMGRFDSRSPGKFLGSYPAGVCFCAQSYFVGSDGIGRVVSSGGDYIIVWKLIIADTVSLAKESETPPLVKNGKGFFTAVADDTAIILAVTRPNDFRKPNVTLYAFDAKNIRTPLFESVAGTWPNIGKPANSNIVPTVVNGKVYVASFKAMSIFGPRGHAFPDPPTPLSV